MNGVVRLAGLGGVANRKGGPPAAVPSSKSPPFPQILPPHCAHTLLSGLEPHAGVGIGPPCFLEGPRFA